MAKFYALHRIAKRIKWIIFHFWRVCELLKYHAISAHAIELNQTHFALRLQRSSADQAKLPVEICESLKAYVPGDCDSLKEVVRFYSFKSIFIISGWLENDISMVGSSSFTVGSICKDLFDSWVKGQAKSCLTAIHVIVQKATVVCMSTTSDWWRWCFEVYLIVQESTMHIMPNFAYYGAAATVAIVLWHFYHSY